MRAALVAAIVAVAGCAPDAARSGVANYGRPRGMPIGTGASGGALELEVAPADELAIPKYEAEARELPVPCGGCVELNVDVNDINQRDEFTFDAGGARIGRVVWTLLVNFNSDQLAVQPFVDAALGPYTALHVNTFPLNTPVAVEQEYSGEAHTIGLVVGSSGAWTGNQTMSVFVDAVSVEGAPALSKTFATGAEGLAPRTQKRNPKLVFHPER